MQIENNLYYISEIGENNKLNKKDIIDKFSNINDKTVFHLDYELNYNSNQLTKILDYYNISSRKLKKLEKISAILDFEEDKDNIQIVERRKRYWSYISELSADPFFKKYIYCDL